MSKNVTLQDKNGVQLFPATTAEQTSFDGSINVKQAIQRIQGSPLVAATAADMTDTSRVYVYTGSESGYISGNWYYYNGSNWVSGGVYNAVAVVTDPTLTQSGVPADAAAVGVVKKTIDATTICKNLIGMGVNVLYPVYIKAGTTITISTSDGSNFPTSTSDVPRLYVYDINGNATDFFGLATGTPYRTATTSANKADTYYISWNRSYSVPLQVEIGSSATSYEEYYPPVKRFYEEYKPVTEYIPSLGDTLSDALAVNLFDPSTATDGGYYDSANVWVANANLYVSDYIPCVNGMRYIINYTQNVNLYDSEYRHIGYIRNSDGDRSFVASSANGNVSYMRVYGFITNKNTDAVFIGDTYHGTAEAYPYGGTALLNKGTPSSMVYGKKVYTFGDSRTWYDGNAYVANALNAGEICKGYQFWMRKVLQCITVNKGVSGYTSPQILNVVQSTDISDADVITLAGGINDFLQNVPVGTIGSIGGTFNTSTVYGATQAMIESILNAKPSVKLMLINPFTGWINNDADQYPNTYADVKRSIAELYGLPLLDLTKFAGFNSLNRSAFYCDDMTKVTYRLHLNDDGNRIIGQMISAFVGNGY